MKIATLLTCSAALLATGACNETPSAAYFNRGSPESLLDMSSEVVNISLTDEAGPDELASWINQEQPSRAEISCQDADPACAKAKNVLDQFKVPYQQEEAAHSGVSLFYERVLARDCENRYINNSINPYNLNHPTFGCSVAANMVQQVTDKRQFVNPNLLDFADGEKAAQNTRNYMKNTVNSSGSATAVTPGSLLNSSTAAP